MEVVAQMDIRLFYLIKIMLTKLRISNEEEFTNEVKENLECYYSGIYTELIDDLERSKIPKFLNHCYADKTCYFTFNGFDSKTNTYFFKYDYNEVYEHNEKPYKVKASVKFPKL